MTTLLELAGRVADVHRSGSSWDESAMLVLERALGTGEITYRSLHADLGLAAQNSRLNWVRVEISPGLTPMLPQAMQHCRHTDRPRIMLAATAVLSHYSMLGPNERPPQVTLRELGARSAARRGDKVAYILLDTALARGAVTHDTLFAELREIVSRPKYGGFGSWMVTFSEYEVVTTPAAVATTGPDDHERIVCIAAHVIEYYRVSESGQQDRLPIPHRVWGGLRWPEWLRPRYWMERVRSW